MVDGAANIKVGLFHLPPFTYKEGGENATEYTYSGMEVSLIKAICNNLGLGITFQEPSDGGDWGGINPVDGTSTGLIHDVIYGKVDVGIAEFFSKPEKNAVADPSEFYTFDHYCFVRSPPPPMPKWQNLVRPFTPGVWVAVLVSLVAAWFFLVLFARLTNFVKLDSVGLTGLSFFVNKAVSLKAGYVLLHSPRLQYCSR